MVLVASLAVPSLATPSPAPEDPSPALQGWASGMADDVLAAVRRSPEKVPAELNRRLKWADADGSLQAMVSLTSRDHLVESFVASNTVDLAWYGEAPRFLARVTPAQLISLLDSPRVLFVEPDYPITNFMSDSAADVRARTAGAEGVYSFDPVSGPLGRLVSNVPGLTAEQVTGTGVRVAITDSGIDKTHRDFGGWDCTPGPYQPCESRIVETATTDHLVPGFESSDALPTTEAVSGHGTHVAGTIGGNGYYTRDGDEDPRYGGDGYTIGIAPNAELISVKNGDSQWAGLSSFALQWQLDNAAELGIKGSSNSWGCLGGCSFNGNSATGQLLRDLYNAGVVVTFAVGNDGGGPDGASFSGNAQSPYVLGVAAYDDATDQLASFSSRGESSAPLYDAATWVPGSEPVNGTRRPDVAAPGVSIWSARSLTGGTSSGEPRININDATGGRSAGFVPYDPLSGTSMATPHVSGAAAVLFGACPAATPLDVMRAIITGANGTKVKKTGGPGSAAAPFEVGYGGLDVRASLDRLLTLEVCGGEGDPDPDPTLTPTPTPTPTPTETVSPGAGATYYFHSSSGSNNFDHVDGSTTFDTLSPTFEEFSSAIDVPGFQTVSGIEVVDPIWRGELVESARSLTLDFWGRTLPDQALGSANYTVRVSTGGAFFELAPAIVKQVPAGSEFVRVTHTFTHALEGTREVPLSLPAGPFTIAVRGTYTVDDAATEIRFDSVDFPSGFSTSGGASPTPTPTPTPSITATPDPTPTDGGTRGSYPEMPNDPYFGEDSADLLAFEPTQWALRKVQAPQAWQQPRATGFGIRVAVLDSGVDLQHEDLQCPGKLHVGSGSDVVNNDSDPDDELGHGTHVAGIIGACTNNGTGVAGVAPDATMVPVRVLNASGSGTDAQLIAGLDKATELGVHVVNMSLGYPPGKNIINNVSAIEAAIDRAQDAGIVLVAAAGNDSFPLCEYPALAEDVICVGATDTRDLKSVYSAFPNKTDTEDTIGPGLVAPGGSLAPFCDTYSENILSTIPLEFDTNGCTDVQGYANNAGTSMAAPHVAGVAALVYDRLGGERGQQVAAEVIGAIIDNTDDLGAPGYDPVFGWGRLNALKAVQAVTPEPDPTPTPTPTPTGEPTPTPTPTESTAPDTTDVSLTGNSATSTQYSDNTLFEARLTDSGSDPIADAELIFELTGAESSRIFNATTDADGIAKVTPVLEETPGPYQLTARYDGDENHAGDADTTSFVVDKEDSALELSETKGKDKALVAHLYDVDTAATGIAGRTIDLYAGAELIGSATTDKDGVATFGPPKQKGKKEPYEAVFEGDEYYLESSDQATGKGGHGRNGGGNGGNNSDSGSQQAEGTFTGKVLLM